MKASDPHVGAEKTSHGYHSIRSFLSDSLQDLMKSEARLDLCERSCRNENILNSDSPVSRFLRTSFSFFDRGHGGSSERHVKKKYIQGDSVTSHIIVQQAVL